MPNPPVGAVRGFAESDGREVMKTGRLLLPVVNRTLKLRSRVLCALTAIASLLYSTSAMAKDVADRNVKVPPGSYQLTCLTVDASANDLRAICQTLNGDWLETALHNPSACTTDISNENGKLTCNRNQPGPPRIYLDAFGEGVPGLDQRGNPWTPLQGATWQLQHDTWTFKDGAPEMSEPWPKQSTASSGWAATADCIALTGSSLSYSTRPSEKNFFRRAFPRCMHHLPGAFGLVTSLEGPVSWTRGE